MLGGTNVTVTGGEYSNNRSGFEVSMYAGVGKFTNVTANDNVSGHGLGAYGTTASAIVTGGTFNGNDIGLDVAMMAGPVAISDVIATDNAQVGVNTSSISESVNILNVTAARNGTGLTALALGSLAVGDSSFDSNVNRGIIIRWIPDAITLDNVTANLNTGPGVDVMTVHSFKDIDGTYTGNDDHGIHLLDIAGDVTLVRTTLDDNDADNDGTGDGVNASDGGDGDSVAIGGKFEGAAHRPGYRRRAPRHISSPVL